MLSIYINTLRNWAEGHFPNNFLSLILNSHQSMIEILRKKIFRVTLFMSLHIKILREKYELTEFLQYISDNCKLNYIPEMEDFINITKEAIHFLISINEEKHI